MRTLLGLVAVNGASWALTIAVWTLPHTSEFQALRLGLTITNAVLLVGLVFFAVRRFR